MRNAYDESDRPNGDGQRALRDWYFICVQVPDCSLLTAILGPSCLNADDLRLLLGEVDKFILFLGAISPGREG